MDLTSRFQRDQQCSPLATALPPLTVVGLCDASLSQRVYKINIAGFHMLPFTLRACTYSLAIGYGLSAANDGRFLRRVLIVVVVEIVQNSGFHMLILRPRYIPFHEPANA